MPRQRDNTQQKSVRDNMKKIRGMKLRSQQSILQDEDQHLVLEQISGGSSYDVALQTSSKKEAKNTLQEKSKSRIMEYKNRHKIDKKVKDCAKKTKKCLKLIDNLFGLDETELKQLDKQLKQPVKEKFSKVEALMTKMFEEPNDDHRKSIPNKLSSSASPRHESSKSTPSTFQRQESSKSSSSKSPHHESGLLPTASASPRHESNKSNSSTSSRPESSNSHSSISSRHECSKSSSSKSPHHEGSKSTSSKSPRHESGLSSSLSASPRHESSKSTSSKSPRHENGVSTSSASPRHENNGSTSSKSPRHENGSSSSSSKTPRHESGLSSTSSTTLGNESNKSRVSTSPRHENSKSSSSKSPRHEGSKSTSSKFPRHESGVLSSSTSSKSPRHESGGLSSSTLSKSSRHENGGLSSSTSSKSPRHESGGLSSSTLSKSPRHEAGSLSSSTSLETPHHQNSKSSTSSASSRHEKGESVTSSGIPCHEKSLPSKINKHRKSLPISLPISAYDRKRKSTDSIPEISKKKSKSNEDSEKNIPMDITVNLNETNHNREKSSEQNLSMPELDYEEDRLLRAKGQEEPPKLSPCVKNTPPQLSPCIPDIDTTKVIAPKFRVLSKQPVNELTSISGSILAKTNIQKHQEAPQQSENMPKTIDKTPQQVENILKTNKDMNNPQLRLDNNEPAIRSGTSFCSEAKKHNSNNKEQFFQPQASKQLQNVLRVNEDMNSDFRLKINQSSSSSQLSSCSDRTQYNHNSQVQQFQQNNSTQLENILTTHKDIQLIRDNNQFSASSGSSSCSEAKKHNNNVNQGQHLQLQASKQLQNVPRINEDMSSESRIKIIQSSSVPLSNSSSCSDPPQHNYNSRVVQQLQQNNVKQVENILRTYKDINPQLRRDNNQPTVTSGSSSCSNPPQYNYSSRVVQQFPQNNLKQLENIVQRANKDRNTQLRRENIQPSIRSESNSYLNPTKHNYNVQGHHTQLVTPEQLQNNLRTNTNQRLNTTKNQCNMVESRSQFQTSSAPNQTTLNMTQQLRANLNSIAQSATSSNPNILRNNCNPLDHQFRQLQTQAPPPEYGAHHYTNQPSIPSTSLHPITNEQFGKVLFPYLWRYWAYRNSASNFLESLQKYNHSQIKSDEQEFRVHLNKVTQFQGCALLTEMSRYSIQKIDIKTIGLSTIEEFEKANKTFNLIHFFIGFYKLTAPFRSASLKNTFIKNIYGILDHYHDAIKNHQKPSKPELITKEQLERLSYQINQYHDIMRRQKQLEEEKKYQNRQNSRQLMMNQNPPLVQQKTQSADNSVYSRKSQNFHQKAKNVPVTPSLPNASELPQILMSPRITTTEIPATMPTLSPLISTSSSLKPSVSLNSITPSSSLLNLPVISSVPSLNLPKSSNTVPSTSSSLHHSVMSTSPSVDLFNNIPPASPTSDQPVKSIPSENLPESSNTVPSSPSSLDHTVKSISSSENLPESSKIIGPTSPSLDPPESSEIIAPTSPKLDQPSTANSPTSSILPEIKTINESEVIEVTSDDDNDDDDAVVEIIDLTSLFDDFEEEYIQNEFKTYILKEESIVIEENDLIEEKFADIKEIVEHEERLLCSPADSGIGSPLNIEDQVCLCGKYVKFVCVCQTSTYCSIECQINDWDNHQSLCIRLTSSVDLNNHIKNN